MRPKTTTPRRVDDAGRPCTRTGGTPLDDCPGHVRSWVVDEQTGRIAWDIVGPGGAEALADVETIPAAVVRALTRTPKEGPTARALREQIEARGEKVPDTEPASVVAERRLFAAARALVAAEAEERKAVLSLTTMTANLPAVIARLGDLRACSEALDWLRALPAGTTWQQAWDQCERGDWLAWLLHHTEESQLWGSQRHRHWYGAKAEILISLARQFSDATTDASIDAMIALCETYAGGGAVTASDFAAGAAAARAARAAGAESLKASAKILRGGYPVAPEVPGTRHKLGGHHGE